MNSKKEAVIYMGRLAGILFLATVISTVLAQAGSGKENALMVYIVGVLLITVCTTGYFYGAFGAVLSVLIFNYFFKVPVHTFVIMNQNDVVLMGFFLVAAFISSSLTVQFRKQMKITEDTKAQMERERLKSSMLRSISHDFRTPLTGILGDAGLLAEAEEMEAGTRKELAGEIKEQAVWLMKTMENILSMTKIESGQLVIKKQPEVVDDMIYEAATHVIGLRDKRKFSVKLPEDIVVALVDGQMMVQVIINLLDNAMKHTKEGDRIWITVAYEKEKMFFSVEDEGEGIDEEILPQIFDEFITQGEGKEDGKRGIGLGLAICRAVIEAHGGKIYARNRKEGGAQFVFWLKAEQVNTVGR
ncbi:MAG: ATP-binding protein [Bariatricus sp.]|nr:ATP-binding protein [Bariatricus sp.]